MELKDYWTRRNILKFLGANSALATLPLGLTGCSSSPTISTSSLPDLGFQPLNPTFEDKLALVEGLRAEVLISYGDKINSKGMVFGYNNDYLAFLPNSSKNPNEGLLWVNHESTSPMFVSGRKKGDPILKRHVRNEMRLVGGSILHIKKKGDHWMWVKNSKRNFRFDAFSKIPFAGNVRVRGQKHAIGTLANCAGGVTPWGTILTCEENYQDFFGETVYLPNGKRQWKPGSKYLMWEKFYKRLPEYYGWVVEINPKTRQAKKLTALGRFSHEGATVTRSKSGKVVVYSGDDAADEHIYKFISDSDTSLVTGTLYVADTVSGKWLPLDREQSPQLKKHFKTQLDVMVQTRRAAKILGATPQHRPEDIEINPANGDVVVALTNHKAKGDFMGQLLKIKETSGDPGSVTFQAETMLSGGSEAGFACPDNLVFDKKGNLWFTTDISGGSIGQKPYESFGNNGLFYVPLNGKGAGKVYRMASAPAGAEFTGPTFAPDDKTLFLSVQHPGEKSKDIKSPRSRWPDYGKSLPKPSVVTIQGPLLDKLLT